MVQFPAMLQLHAMLRFVTVATQASHQACQYLLVGLVHQNIRNGRDLFHRLPIEP